MSMRDLNMDFQLVPIEKVENKGEKREEREWGRRGGKEKEGVSGKEIERERGREREGTRDGTILIKLYAQMVLLKIGS